MIAYMIALDGLTRGKFHSHAELITLSIQFRKLRKTKKLN